MTIIINNNHIEFGIKRFCVEVPGCDDTMIFITQQFSGKLKRKETSLSMSTNTQGRRDELEPR